MKKSYVEIELAELGYTWEEYVEAQIEDIETLISDIDDYVNEEFGYVGWGIYNDNEDRETITLEISKD